jgi:hypothetical protein
MSHEHAKKFLAELARLVAVVKESSETEKKN